METAEWMDFDPRVSRSGDEVVSARCVWCGARGGMSGTHIIPKSFGSGYEPRMSCKHCNNVLGSAVEARAWENAYIQAALAKLGIADRRKAYRRAKRKVDLETGFEMKIDKQGRASIVPHPRAEGGYIGTNRQQMGYYVALFKRLYPNVDTTPVEEFFDDPTRDRLVFKGHTINRKQFDADESAWLRIESTSYVHPYWVFKVAYETLSVCGFFGSAKLRHSFRRLYRVCGNEGGERLVFSSLIGDLVLTNLQSGSDIFKALEEIPFEHDHYWCLHLTPRMVLYLEIVLFAQIQLFFLIGLWNWKDQSIAEYLDRVFYYPKHGVDWRMQPFPNLQAAPAVKRMDSVVEQKLSQLVARQVWY